MSKTIIRDGRTQPDDLPGNQKQVIRDTGDLRYYRTELPNMADDDLGPFEFRLYGHYKRVCGGTVDGECFENLSTTSKRCQMSRTRTIQARDNLVASGWIQVEQDEKTLYHVTIINRWPENFSRYSPQSKNGLVASPKMDYPQSKNGRKEVTSIKNEQNTSIPAQEKPRTPAQQAQDAIDEYIAQAFFNWATAKGIDRGAGVALGRVKGVFSRVYKDVPPVDRIEIIKEFVRWWTTHPDYKKLALPTSEEKVSRYVTEFMMRSTPKQARVEKAVAAAVEFEEPTPAERAAALRIMERTRSSSENGD